MKVFVYGSLMSSEVLKALLGRIPLSREGVLYGYNRRFLQDRCYPAIYADAHSAVSGKILSDLTPAECKLLDAFEDDCYELKEVEIVLDKSGTEKAFAYTLPPKNKNQLTDRDWSFEHFLEHNLSDYLAGIARFKSRYYRDAE